MLLASMLRIAAHHIKTNGKIPSMLAVRHEGGVVKFNRTTVLGIACKITRKRRSMKLGIEHDHRIVKHAGYLLFKANENSPAAGWCLKNKEKQPLRPEDVIDCRVGYQNGLMGAARERLLAILDPELDCYKSTSHHYAFLHAIGNKIIVVDSLDESFKIQEHLARKGCMNVVLTTSEVEGYFKGVCEDGFNTTKVVAHG